MTLGIWGAKPNYFQGAKVYFRNLGRLVHYFKGASEHRPCWGPQLYAGS